MNLKKFAGLLLVAFSCLTMGLVEAAEKPALIGIVNFGECIEVSKFGKLEKKNFENFRNHMVQAITDLDKQLNETATKLQDKEFLDSLSPEAETQLKEKFQSLGEDLNRYQNQYYQAMQQAQMGLMQKLHDLVNEASSLVAKNQKLSMVISKEAAFYYSSSLDITSAVIAELDKRFEKEGRTLDEAIPTTTSAS